jgi:biopolymer transport protein ExbD
MLGGTFQRRRPNAEAKLLITSMMDIFTIILAFLLFQFSTEDQSIMTVKNVELPWSSSELKYEDAIRVAVSATSVQVGEKAVVEIRDGKIVGTIVEGKKIDALYRELRRQKAILEFKAKQKGTGLTEADSVILFHADKRIPYSIVDKVLKTAGMAGFPKFRLVVYGRAA